MKILFLTCFRRNDEIINYGGAEKSIINLANWLDINTDNEVYIYSVEGDGKPYPINEGIKYQGCYIKKNSKIQTHLRMAENTINAINEVLPDIVISFWIHPLFYGLIKMKIKKIPFVYSERNDPRLEYGLLSRMARYFVIKYCNKIVFQTHGAKNYFGEMVDKKGIVIHNPVYIKKGEFEYKKSDNRIVSVGRLSNQKNHSLLLRAFSELISENEDLILEIYGDGMLKDELSNLIVELGLEGKAFLMGASSDVLHKINGAKLFVMTSIYEGMPNALMEAMSLGIPVLSSDCPCGGPMELIDDGINGFLFKNNDLDDLVRCIKKILLLSNDEIQKIQNAEQIICDTHSQDEIFSCWNNLLGDIY